MKIHETFLSILFEHVCSMYVLCNGYERGTEIEKSFYPQKKYTAKDVNAPKSYMCTFIMPFSIDNRTQPKTGIILYRQRIIMIKRMQTFYYAIPQQRTYKYEFICLLSVLSLVFTFFLPFLIPVLFMNIFFLHLSSLMNLIYILHVTVYANQTKSVENADVLIYFIGYFYI